MIQLGELDAPDGRKAADLSMAKHTIEILEMLEEKTHGNLEGHECRLLTHVVEDLKHRYTRKTSQ